MNYYLSTEMTIERSLEDTFALFGDAENLETLTPPELRFEIRTPLPIEMKRGARIEYRIRLFGVPFSWLTEITCWEPGVRFVDEQISGPFRTWIHEHHFESIHESATRIRDEVLYALPVEPIGRIVHPLIRSRLDRIFEYRQMRVRQLLTPREPTSESRHQDASTGDSKQTPESTRRRASRSMPTRSPSF
jgi:ligand-binding SRPBCC domain-containing protein